MSTTMDVPPVLQLARAAKTAPWATEELERELERHRQREETMTQAEVMSRTHALEHDRLREELRMRRVAAAIRSAGIRPRYVRPATILEIGGWVDVEGGRAPRLAIHPLDQTEVTAVEVVHFAGARREATPLVSSRLPSPMPARLRERVDAAREAVKGAAYYTELNTAVAIYDARWVPSPQLDPIAAVRAAGVFWVIGAWDPTPREQALLLEGTEAVDE